MSFTRKPYATPFGATTFTEGFQTAYTQLDWTRKAGFAISFYVRVLTQAADCLCGNLVCALWGSCTGASVAFPLTYQKHLLLPINYYDIANATAHWASFKASCQQQGSATKQRNEISAFFTVSLQNRFSSTLHWRATLPSLCIKYLYTETVFCSK